MTYLKTTLLYLLIFGWNTAKSQENYTIRLSANLGGGGSYEKTYSNTEDNIKSDVSTLCMLNTGYNISKFRISAGIGFMATSYSRVFTGLLFEPDFDKVTGLPINEPVDYTVYNIYRYIALPVTAGYVISLSDRVHVVPEVGLMPLYNLPIIVKQQYNGEKTNSYSVGPWKTFSLSGITMVNVEYYLKRNIAITAGGSYTKMIVGLQSDIARSRREYTYGGGIGVLFRF